MLDLFGPSADQINQSNQAHAVNFLTLALALTHKGVLTVEELETARIQALHLVEQESARKRDEAAKIQLT